MNLWTLSLLSLLSPPPRSSCPWLLLFITRGVALGAASKEVGSKSPLSHFLGKASQNKKNLDHFYLFYCGLGQSLGRAGMAQVGPAPSLLPCSVPLPLWTLCTSPRLLSHRPSSRPP